MPYSRAIVRIHLSDLMLICDSRHSTKYGRKFSQIKRGSDSRSSAENLRLKIFFADVHHTVANRELEVWPAGAGARAHGAFGDAGFFACLERVISVDDLASAQDLRVDVATETRRQIDVDRARCDAEVRATAAPASRRDTESDRTRRDRSINNSTRERERGVALSRTDLHRTFNSRERHCSMTGIDFKIGVDGNAKSIVDLPRHVEQLLREVLRRLLHERAIVRAGGEDAQVIQVFVKNEIIYFRKLVQVSFGRAFDLDVSRELDFVSCPTFDCYRASRCSDQRHRTAVRETTQLVTLRSARQELHVRRCVVLRKNLIG